MIRWMLLPSLFLLAQGAGQPEPRYFRYQRAVTLGDSAAGQRCAALDAAVFTHAARDLSDLRLYSGTRDVPFAFDLGAGTNVTDHAPPTILNRGVRDGHVVFDAHLMHPSYSKIELRVDAKDFIASVEVTGSATADGASPTRLGTFAIFDLTGQQLTRSTVLTLPASNFPYLHFTVTGPLKPEQVTGIAVLEAERRAPVYRAVGEAAMVREGKRSVARFNIPSRVPVEHVEIVPGESRGNFSRAVVVEAKRPSAPEPERFAGTFFRVHTVQGGLRIDQDQFALDLLSTASDTAITRWSVIIDNGDDLPLPVQSVRLAMRERRICFDAVPGAAYTLAYGDSALRPPRYDYATLFQAAAHPGAATLDAEGENPHFEPRPDTRPLTERYPALLWGVLGLVVVGLGAVALRSARRLKLSGEP